ncbi:hypothetical protein [Chitinimonas taiwanensis]|uniref:hypothetical protein n=1 Tax=Chitinimonas taiwanensis TaxID=240412 RepID=UPI0035AEA05A
MTNNSNIEAHNWRPASKLSMFRWPATFSFAGTVVCLLNLATSGNKGLSIGPISFRLFDALCIFSCVLIATFPIWYYTTSRRIGNKPTPPKVKQALICFGSLILALLMAPRFEIEHRDYETQSQDNVRDFTTVFIKRSFLETIQVPKLALDELTWLQSNYSADYIPAAVFCPRRSTRLYPFIGTVHEDHLANALAAGAREEDEGRPPAAALANGIARCNQEGPAMLARGYTKESSLLRGDIDQFFERNALEVSFTSIVLSDAQIPPAIMAKIELTLTKNPDQHFYYIEDTNFDTVKGQVRRFTPLVLAEAFGRSDDIARLRKHE